MKTNFNRLNKYRTLFLVLPVAMLLANCGEKKPVETSASGASLTSTSNNSSGSTGNTNNNNNGNTNTGNTGNTTNGCNKTVISGPAYSYSLSGAGTAKGSTHTVNTPNGVIHADQMLKVQVVPQTSSGQQGYEKMGAEITLLRNGSPVSGATFTIPGGVDANGYRNGLDVGTKSSIIDFSSFLTPGNYTYSIRVAQVRTNYKCKTYCNSTNYNLNNSINWFIGQYGYYPYYTNDWNLVYTHQASMINSCKQLQCNVGDMDYSTTAGWAWKIQVSVENDTTQCLTP